jgi:mannose-6-phosphate isomerase-like protein (cupin superfamily)
MLKNKIIKKVWGNEELVINTNKYCGKILNLKKGYRCSMHLHKKKDETFYILEGKVLIELWKGNYHKKKVMVKGDTQRITPRMIHRFTGLKKSRMAEFSTQHRENDSYRISKSEKVNLNKLEVNIN